jgi:hypothetical protein
MILEAAEIRDSQTSSSDADQVTRILLNLLFILSVPSRCFKKVLHDTGDKSVKCKQSRRVSVLHGTWYHFAPFDIILDSCLKQLKFKPNPALLSVFSLVPVSTSASYS